ncbi:MAG: hypothetical protein WCD07_00315 [Burkholderiales bacterium]
MIEIKPIDLSNLQNDIRTEATRDIRNSFDVLVGPVREAYSKKSNGDAAEHAPPNMINTIYEILALFEKLDQEYGSEGPLPIEDAEELSDHAIRYLAELGNWLPRLELGRLQTALNDTIVGTALWAVRHGCAIGVAEPVVNALALRANDAGSKEALAAIYGIQQGVIKHLAPRYQHDLEKSDPQRAWRILNLNFAIVAIRSQDMRMMSFAFKTLGDHLPEECPGFFEEAIRLAQHPAFSDEVKDVLHGEHARWASRH